MLCRRWHGLSSWTAAALSCYLWWCNCQDGFSWSTGNTRGLCWRPVCSGAQRSVCVIRGFLANTCTFNRLHLATNDIYTKFLLQMLTYSQINKQGYETTNNRWGSRYRELPKIGLTTATLWRQPLATLIVNVFSLFRPSIFSILMICLVYHCFPVDQGHSKWINHTHVDSSLQHSTQILSS